jgi:hypothetical protein
MTTCRKFIRRIKPQGISVLCNKPATYAIVAVCEDGREVVHGEYCEKHAQKAALSYTTNQAGWHIEIRAIA